MVRSAIGCWFFSALVLLGQISSPNGINSAELSSGLRLRLTEAQAELSAISAVANASTNLPPGATAFEVSDRQLIAEALVRAYQEHLEQLASWDDARRRQSEMELQANAWKGFAQPPPYSILLVDSLRDSIQALTASIKAGETSLEVLRALSEDAGSALKKSDEHSRLVAEQLESDKDISRVTRLTWLRGIEKLRNQMATASAGLNETRRLKIEAELAAQRQQLILVQRQLAIASQRIRFSETDMEQVIAKLEVEQRQIKQEIIEAQTDSDRRHRELSSIQGELRPAVETSTGTGVVSVRGPAVERLQALAELRTAQVETSLQKLALLRHLADAIINERGIWQMRFALFDSQDLAKLKDGYERIEHLRRLVRIVRPHFLQQIDRAASFTVEQRNHAGSRSGVQADPVLINEMEVCLQQREDLAQRGLRALDRMERLATRWEEALDQSRANLPAATRVRDLFSELSSFATKLWQLELFAAQDTITVDGQKITGRRTVTVGKIAEALIILAVGYWLSLRLSRFLERLAINRFKVEPNQANLIRRWARVVLVLLLVVLSLVSVKIPLTVFAFLGGALAIGLGFGTQNLLKNFISGIIILFERPFRVGDVLDVAGHRGTVMSIGIRSSVLRLRNGTETLIPNSTLLENNLTNWTYSDRHVRFSITVGVAYGSDTRRVAQLLQEVAERHGLVQKQPTPQVLFQEFGDNALTFELLYWVNVVEHNAPHVGSDLRHMIRGVFADHGIAIPFPQRDLHLDTTRPLQIQLLSAEAPSAGILQDQAYRP